MNLSYLILELLLLGLLGVLYYFYQRKKILRYEEEKIPIILGGLLQACLIERDEHPGPEIDALIEALDDFLHNKTSAPPLALLDIFAHSSKCTEGLKEVILESLTEIQA